MSEATHTCHSDENMSLTVLASKTWDWGSLFGTLCPTWEEWMPRTYHTDPRSSFLASQNAPTSPDGRCSRSVECAFPVKTCTKPAGVWIALALGHCRLCKLAMCLREPPTLSQAFLLCPLAEKSHLNKRPRALETCFQMCRDHLTCRWHGKTGVGCRRVSTIFSKARSTRVISWDMSSPTAAKLLVENSVVTTHMNKEIWFCDSQRATVTSSSCCIPNFCSLKFLAPAQFLHSWKKRAAVG